jgi:hypothetical protein
MFMRILSVLLVMVIGAAITGGVDYLTGFSTSVLGSVPSIPEIIHGILYLLWGAALGQTARSFD